MFQYTPSYEGVIERGYEAGHIMFQYASSYEGAFSEYSVIKDQWFFQYTPSPEGGFIIHYSKFQYIPISMGKIYLSFCQVQDNFNTHPYIKMNPNNGRVKWKVCFNTHPLIRVIYACAASSVSSFNTHPLM